MTFAIAERLSFFLGESIRMSHFALAQQGKPRDSETLRSEVDRLLENRKENVSLRSFLMPG